MPGDGPLVSVLATCFNQERFVVDCLESIRAQTYRNVELIVADDCSTDASASAIREWVGRTGTKCTLLVHDENQGVCRTRNHALAHASGDYVAGIDMDDVWLPDKLAVQVDQLERLPSTVGVAYGDALRVDEHSRPLPGLFVENHGVAPPPQGDVYEALLERNFIPDVATLVRRACYQTVGGYDEALVYEDWDLWLRIARWYQFAFTPRVCAHYRVHPGSLSHVLARNGGVSWWESDMRILLKHIGYSPRWDAVLWDRIARAAYRLDRSERLEYARANLRANRSLAALALYVLCRAGIGYRHVAPFKQPLNAVRRKLRRRR